MPFPYAPLISLLDSLFTTTLNHHPSSLSNRKALHIRHRTLLTSWFTHHRPAFLTTSLKPTSLFSLLLPDLRPDRVYALKEDALVRIVARSLGLGISRTKQLQRWKEDADGDLGEMVGRVMAAAENPVPELGMEVTVEEVDAALETLAGRSIFSSQSKQHRTRSSSSIVAHEVLGPLLRRMSSGEAKWFIRAILKSYLPLVVPREDAMWAYHFLLPHLYDFQNDLRRAFRLLETPVMRIFPARPEAGDVEGLLEGAGRLVEPEVGVRVGRVEFGKATSCKHAAQMAKGARMAMERKYDGEYCQIHIDLSRGNNWIRIFSKSGRDSTKDRAAAHSIIHKALNIDDAKKRKFHTKCILEAELVVYSDKEQEILEFYHIRSHVNRAGLKLGIKADETPDFANEHLMLIFYDLLLLDSHPYLIYPYDRRRPALETLIITTPGQSILSETTEINFSSSNALETLRSRFAEGIAKRYEGFVLKPCEAPYLSFGIQNCEWIKLKKDYIQGLGDTGDFAIVGGGYEAERGRERGMKGSGITTFFVGGLVNREAVVRFDARPEFQLMFHVSYNIATPELQYLNQLAYFHAQKFKKGTTNLPEYTLLPTPNLPQMDVYFPVPLVFELMGGGFDKSLDTPFYILRWPRVVKIHYDRDWKNALGFDEVQDMAEEAVRISGSSRGRDQEEEKQWLERLEEADKGKREKKEEGSGVVTRIGKKRALTMVGGTAVKEASLKIIRDTSTVKLVKSVDKPNAPVARQDVAIQQDEDDPTSTAGSVSSNFWSGNTTTSTNTTTTNSTVISVPSSTAETTEFTTTTTLKRSRTESNTNLTSSPVAKRRRNSRTFTTATATVPQEHASGADQGIELNGSGVSGADTGPIPPLGTKLQRGHTKPVIEILPDPPAPAPAPSSSSPRSTRLRTPSISKSSIASTTTPIRSPLVPLTNTHTHNSPHHRHHRRRTSSIHNIPTRMPSIQAPPLPPNQLAPFPIPPPRIPPPSRPKLRFPPKEYAYSPFYNTIVLIPDFLLPGHKACPKGLVGGIERELELTGVVRRHGVSGVLPLEEWLEKVQSADLLLGVEGNSEGNKKLVNDRIILLINIDCPRKSKRATTQVRELLQQAQTLFRKYSSSTPITTCTTRTTITTTTAITDENQPHNPIAAQFQTCESIARLPEIETYDYRATLHGPAARGWEEWVCAGGGGYVDALVDPNVDEKRLREWGFKGGRMAWEGWHMGEV